MLSRFQFGGFGDFLPKGREGPREEPSIQPCGSLLWPRKDQQAESGLTQTVKSQPLRVGSAP